MDLNDTPLPRIPTPEETVWNTEPFDDLYPRDGWINDLIFNTRGVATPTFGAFWSGVFLISSVLRRGAYLDWVPFKLYPNFYIILVAMPKVCAKSTVVNIGTGKILSKFGQFIEDPYERVLKTPPIFSKLTPEAFSEVLKPKEETHTFEEYHEGKKKNVTKIFMRYSEAVIVASELTTFLGKQKYLSGLVDRITDLYDCADFIPMEYTLGRGGSSLEKVFLSFIAGTTPEHLHKGIPDEAMGGGFISRTTIVSLKPTRGWPNPFIPRGSPSYEELQKTIAWVAHNKMGVYTFTKEAFFTYQEWYKQYYKDFTLGAEAKKQYYYQRFDIQLLKLCVILTAQRYDLSREIDTHTFKSALKILEYTFTRGFAALENVGESAYTGNMNSLRRMIKEKKQLSRRQVLQRLSPSGCKADQVTEILNHLHQQGTISIYLDGMETQEITKNGKEIYKWADFRK